MRRPYSASGRRDPCGRPRDIRAATRAARTRVRDRLLGAGGGMGGGGGRGGGAACGGALSGGRGGGAGILGARERDETGLKRGGPFFLNRAGAGRGPLRQLSFI